MKRQRGRGFGLTSPSFSQTVDAMQELKSQEPNQTGFNVAHSTQLPFFDYLFAKPDFAARFTGSMANIAATTPGMSPTYLIDGYAWGSLPPSSTIVDVGGSEGHVSIALARAFPHLKFVVQDRTEVIEGAEAKLPEDLRAGIQDPEPPIRFMAHDFFKSQPVVRAAVYLLRWCAHDWPDAYVVRILRALVPALRNGSRVVLNDSVLPEAGTVPIEVEKTIRGVDLVMLSLHNLRERESEEWAKIFQEADGRFGKVKITVPPGAVLGIIEAVWKG